VRPFAVRVSPGALVPASTLALFEWVRPMGGGATVAIVGLVTGVALWRAYPAWGTSDHETGSEVAIHLALGAAPMLSGLLCIAAALTQRRAWQP
jgi:hypothetical protein